MTKKFRLLIRMWVKQTPLYGTVAEAHEVGKKIAKEEDIAVEEVEVKEVDIAEQLATYKKRLAEFERQMEEIGVEVAVSASFRVYTSTVEDADTP